MTHVKMTMIENLESTALLWLAVSEDHFDIHYHTELRKSINYLVTFTNTNECENCIRKCCSTETRVVLILDKHFAHDFVRRIHNIRQLSSIYIFGEDKEELKVDFNKVSDNLNRFEKCIENETSSKYMNNLKLIGK